MSTRGAIIFIAPVSSRTKVQILATTSSTRNQTLHTDVIIIHHTLIALL